MQEAKRSAQQRYAAELQAQVQAKYQRQAEKPQPPSLLVPRPGATSPGHPFAGRIASAAANAGAPADPMAPNRQRQNQEYLQGLQEQMRAAESRKQQERQQMVEQERRAMQEADARGQAQVSKVLQTSATTVSSKIPSRPILK